ncbi:MAG: sigma-70 family RNA polymerase sigma factor [Cyanobium sp.]
MQPSGEPQEDSEQPLRRPSRTEQNQSDLIAFRLCSDERQRRLLRERLVRNNLPLVYAITARMARTVQLPSDDLQQIGSIGLLRAIEAFQPSRGRSLSSFAVPYIRGAIQHELRDRCSLVRIPRDLWELRRRATALQEARERRGQASLAPQALAEALGCDPSRLLEALQLSAVTQMRSLDAPLNDATEGEARGRSLLEHVADPASLDGLSPEAFRTGDLDRSWGTSAPAQGGKAAHLAMVRPIAGEGSRRQGSTIADRLEQPNPADPNPSDPNGAAGNNQIRPHTAARPHSKQHWLRHHMAGLEPLQRELLLGHVCCGRSWAELGRELGLHPRQAQRLTTALLLRLQREGHQWRQGSTGSGRPEEPQDSHPRAPAP